MVPFVCILVLWGQKIWKALEAVFFSVHLGSSNPRWIILFKPMISIFRFSLYYYCDRTFKDNIVKNNTKLTIDTSSKRVEQAPEFDAEDEVEEPPLESLIRTKSEILNATVAF